jgi:hypothetical protein
MKIWTGYDSEHSYSLVMIGHFADETAAKRTAKKFERLAETAETELADRDWDFEERLSEDVRKTLAELKLFDLSSTDVEQFGLEHSVELVGRELRITTDEGQVQGFLKVLIDAGAKVEVFSGHHWREDGQPQGREATGTDGEQTVGDPS